MKTLLFALAFAVPACAQPTKAPPPPAAPTPNFCTVTYAVATETTADQQDVGTVVNTVQALPWADVQDNHAKNLKVVDALSKEQGKGGPYSITTTETRQCDNGPTVRVSDTSLEFEGVTLDGSVRALDVAIQQAKEINDRYRNRAGQGAKVAWNHKNAKKVKRNDLGQRVDN